MKCFQIQALGDRTLEAKELAIPEPGDEQVLIQVQAAGLCHSDCHILHGALDHLIRKRPLTLGHEVAGVIVKTGPGVTDHKIGDKIAAALVTYPVSTSDWNKTIGLGYDGGFAEFAVVDLINICPIPDGVTFPQAAVATDSIATAYHAVVVEGQVGPSTTVAIIGLGGLGLNGVAIAALQGAKVIGIDVDAEKFPEALHCGALACYGSLDTTPQLDFDVVIDFAGVGTTTANAIRAVKIGGTVVQVGLGVNQALLPMYELVTKCVTLRGSMGSSLDELREVLKLVASGHISPVLEEIPFSGVPLGLQRLESQQVKGRLFTNPSLS